MAVVLRSCNSGGPFGTVLRPSRALPSPSGTVHAPPGPSVGPTGRTARPSQSAALVLDGLGGRYRRLRVEVAPARRHGAVRRIKLVQQRDAGGDVELRNRRVTDPVQVLDQGTQRVAVSHY